MNFSNYYEIITGSLYLKGLAIVIISFFAAKTTDVVFTMIFKRIVQKTKTKLDDQILHLLHRPVFYTILFIGLVLSVKVTNIPSYVDYFLVGTFKTGIIVIWLFVVSKILVMSVSWVSKKTKSTILQKNTIPLFNNIGKILIGILGIYFIFLSWDININGILASAGVLGVVLGLAAKDTVSNFFAGFFLLADAPYKEGDYILLDTGERGYVKKMGLRSTRFMTRDDIEITIPNSVVAASKIVNESGGPLENERVRVNLQVSYGSDLEKVKTLLNEIARSEAEVMSSPKPRVRFREFSDYGMRLQLLFWIAKPESRGRVVDAINTKIYENLKENKISIPYPTMEVIIPPK